MRFLFPTDYKPLALQYYDDWQLVLSLIKAESNFKVTAESSAGACGLMQILPETADFIAKKENIEGYDLFSAEDNIRLGCAYLIYLEGKFSSVETVLAAYNAGEGTVREWLTNREYSSDGVFLQEIPYPETRNYVEKIKKYYKIYRKIYLTNSGK